MQPTSTNGFTVLSVVPSSPAVVQPHQQVGVPSPPTYEIQQASTSQLVGQSQNSQTHPSSQSPPIQMQHQPPPTNATQQAQAIVQQSALPTNNLQPQSGNQPTGWRGQNTLSYTQNIVTDNVGAVHPAAYCKLHRDSLVLFGK